MCFCCLQVMEFIVFNALLSSLLNPLEGPSVLNRGNMELGGCSRLPAQKGGRGACYKSRD